MVTLSRETVAAAKARTPLDGLIGQRVPLGRPNRKGIRDGMCLCNPQKGKRPLWVNPQTSTWGCLKGGAVCGGDTFTYLEQFEGLDFKAALARLGGAAITADPAATARIEAERQHRIAAMAARAAALDEAEREKAFEMWRRAMPAVGTLADAYFRQRGLQPIASKALRFARDEPYWFVPDAADAAPIVVHRGPCLYAAIQAPDGRFLGLHRTWLDARLATGELPRLASGKAAITAPDGTPLPAKKMRGGKQGGAIRLYDPPGLPADVFIAGEGIETVATVAQKLQDRGQFYFGAWAAGDLGNLSGAGLGPSTPHPARAGHYVPSDVPDPAAPGLLPPRWARAGVLLGDGDSDPHVTQARLLCAQRRWAAAGVPTTIVMAGAGVDFNDLVRGQA